MALVTNVWSSTNTNKTGNLFIFIYMNYVYNSGGGLASGMAWSRISVTSGVFIFISWLFRLCWLHSLLIQFLFIPIRHYGYRRIQTYSSQQTSRKKTLFPHLKIYVKIQGKSTWLTLLGSYVQLLDHEMIPAVCPMITSGFIQWWSHFPKEGEAYSYLSKRATLLGWPIQHNELVYTCVRRSWGWISN